MVDAIVSFGVEKLGHRLSQEYEQFQGVEDQVNELKDKLDGLKAFLKDADAKKNTNESVRQCVEKIKEIVYDAEDIIETFILKEKIGKKFGIMKRLRRFACTIVDRRELASDIGGISKRISTVIQDMQNFGVEMVITDGSWSSHPLQERQREMRQTFSREYESDFVGLEAKVKKLVGYMVEKDDIQIVSVTGMGGLGKTTIARQVFNHEDVKRQFDGLAWVCVSQDFTRKNVWQNILGDLKPNEEEKKILEMTESKLQDELFRLLETSKSLIVFDDIWREEDWDLVKPIFPPKKGWKVLLTSRNESVAMCRDTKYINFKPECLTIEDSWTLFQRIAMPRKDTPEFKIDKKMEEMGKQMVQHCGGLPLAIKVLGGFLAAKCSVHDWKRLSENIGSRLVGGRTDFNYVLSLSFEELPSYLKHCFLYLAHFPEDHKINVEKLSYYWAAEGISEPRHYDGDTIRDVGDSYIEELVRRNIVISEREATTLRFETCHLHDMMREVCLFKATEENFLQITSSRPPTANFQSHVTSRRFVSHNPSTLHVDRDINNPKLRSLVVVQGNESFGKKWNLSGSSYARLELLRVLDLFGAVFEGGKLPSGIGKLIHLRYLCLKEVEVSHLPSSLGNLLLLIYLNLDISGSTFVPNVLMGMQELRYLALPRSMHKKTNLELSNLEKLETLLHFSTENNSVRDLHRMTKLRTLLIYRRGEGCATETLSSSISELSSLEDLTIDSCLDFIWIDPTNDEKGFYLDCIHLKKLHLEIYMPRLPDEQHFPSHLTTIALTYCRLVEDPMPILEKLVQLKELKLRYQSFSGRRMVCLSGGFPQLHRLGLFALKEWEEWIVEEGSMPLLHFLHIWRCPKLKKLHIGGFPQLHTLRIEGLEEWEEWIVEEGSMPLLHTLDIYGCPKLKKLPAGGFPQLQKLTIWGLMEWEEWIVEEGSMPLLHTLAIWSCPKLKELPADGFPQLHTLYLSRLEEWEEWIVEEGFMPLLHSLSIRKCPNLKKLPDGLSLIYSLKDLRMDKEWKERLSEGGEDYYKVKHIPSVKFYY